MAVDEFDSEKLADLSPEDAAKLFGSLLWCSARRAGISIESITITTKIDLADGGIDAALLSNAVTPKECGLFGDPRFITVGPGATLLDGLAEARPQATLACIERTVGKWLHDCSTSLDKSDSMS